MPSRPKRKTYPSTTPAAANLTGFASNVTGSTWTLTSTEATDGLAHQVTIRNDSATDYSTQDVTLTGTNPEGLAMTVTTKLPAGSATITTDQYFLTLTSVVPATGIGGDTMDIGWAAAVAMPCIPFNWRGKEATLDIDVTGTINYTIQYSPSLIQTETPPFDWRDSNDASVVAVTTSETSSWNVPVMATRVVINSASAGGSVTLTIIQYNEDI